MARSTAREAAAKREQILEAAIRRFAHYSYEDASLRAIAADVGVDVAHVHRSFGSKEQLLVEAIRAMTPPIERLLSGPMRALPAKLADELFSHRPTARDDVGVFDIFVRSLTSQEASAVLRKSIDEDFIGPLSQRTSPQSRQRAALILAMLLGVGVLREVIGIDALAIDRDFREPLINAFERLMGESDPA